MTAVEPLEPRWSNRRRWGLVAAVFAVQLGLIFWLSDRTPLRPRPPASAPTLQLAGDARSELLLLNDPTLFVLPHWQGFSGPAWLQVPARESPSFSWDEPPQWLALPVHQLAATFSHFVKTNGLEAAHVEPKRQPALTLPAATFPGPAHDRSELRLEGDLARRRLLSSFHLPLQPATDLLTNTVVQMAVDASGIPVSATLLGRSGSAAADQEALARARTARFQPVGAGGSPEALNPLAHLTWGLLVFQWYPAPPAATNTPAGTTP